MCAILHHYESIFHRMVFNLKYIGCVFNLKIVFLDAKLYFYDLKRDKKIKEEIYFVFC